MIGRGGPTGGFAAKVIGGEVTGLTIGSCGHTHCTTTTASAVATAGQVTRVSFQRASSRSDLDLAEGNRRPRFSVLLLNDLLIPAT